LKLFTFCNADAVSPFAGFEDPLGFPILELISGFNLFDGAPLGLSPPDSYHES
uniref:Chlorophyll a-b binding protein, chloroplastic n=1 Tax=Haemonchus placei TaxID=6290 RepID=A0A0N4WZX5_HAEPC